MGFGIQNSAQGIHNLPAIGIWIQAPLRRNPESRIQGLQFGIHNPRLSWITLHQWGNTVLALVTLAHRLIAQQQITHRSYLISLWLPSICQRAKGPYTWYFRRWRTFNVFKSSDLRRQPSGFTRCIAERILLCSGVVFFLRAKDLSFFYIQHWENPSVSQ